SNYAVTSLALNETDSILFASTQNRQVRRLTSPGKPFPFGATWELVGGPSTWTNKVAMGSNDERLYIGMPGAGTRRCENPNDTIPPPPTIVDMGGEPSDDAHSMLHFAYQQQGDNLFATTKKGTEYYTFRCEEPGGAVPRTWTDMGWPASGKIGYSTLLYSPEDDTLFVAGQGIVYRCREPGTSSTWTDMTGDFSGEWAESIAYDEDWRYLYVGTQSGGVWRAHVDYKPRLDSIDPGSGPVGTTVTIEGDLFGPAQWNSYVTFGYEQAADYVSWSDDKIEVKVPDTASGSADVKVTTVGGTSDAAIFAVEPVITGVTPSGACAGTAVEISGTGFGTSRGSSSVAFGGQNASGYGSWSSTGAEAVVPVTGLGTVDLTVKTRGGTSNAVDFEVTGATYYFAEGYTAPGFQEYLCIGNAGDSDAYVDVTYIFNDGTDPKTETYQVPAESRYTVDVNSAAGAGKEVSLKVESSSPDVVAERPMYFEYQGPNTRGWSGGHDAVGAPALDREWYFAEGTTRSGFEQ
ncbi:MAG: IPT/TIG domain-containing protein, partial [Gemmatimonadetes bacterium]|nr:IPT/TIG domain-containing protein [Gemmatimonadota bacterium]